MMYAVCKLSLDPDGSVNDERKTDDVITLPVIPTAGDIIAELRRVGRVTSNFPTKWINVECEGDIYYISNKRTGKKWLSLHPDPHVDQDDGRQLRAIAEEIADKTCSAINEETKNIKTPSMPYKTQYVLEHLIEILKVRV